MSDGESKCLKCGRCCRHKFNVGGRLVFDRAACKHWDPETKLCRVYNEREKLAPECCDIASATLRGILPDDCPYVEGLVGYKGPREASDMELYVYRMEVARQAFEAAQKEKEK